MTADTEVRDSEVVSGWHQPLVRLCDRSLPDSCDCGFVGEWEWRFVMVWETRKGARGDRQVRRDLERGFPARFGEQGCWMIGGRDERCPGCGDIERFTLDAYEQVKRWRPEPAVAEVVHMRPRPVTGLNQQGDDL